MISSFQLSFGLSPVTLDYPVAITNCYTSHVTPMSEVTGDMLIATERSF